MQLLSKGAVHSILYGLSWIILHGLSCLLSVRLRMLLRNIYMQIACWLHTTFVRCSEEAAAMEGSL